MFVWDSTYQREVYKRRDAESKFDILVDKYNQLVRKINRHGGADLFNEKETGQQLSKSEINKMLSLCHPDKHGGKKVATDMTRKLLELRQ